jgi:predicted transcriptional regulator
MENAMVIVCGVVIARFMKIKQRNTAVQSYHDIVDSLPDRRMAVYNALLELKTACNLDVAEFLKLPINRITPRMNELVSLGVVTEDHRGICGTTGRRVIYWKGNRNETYEQSSFLRNPVNYD